MLMASKRHIWMFMAVRRDSLWSRPEEGETEAMNDSVASRRDRTDVASSRENGVRKTVHGGSHSVWDV